MKKILPLLIVMLSIFSPLLLKAQDFSMTQDTVWLTTVSTPAFDYIINSSASPITLRWQVIATDFPADWLADTALGMCDNNVCYGNNAGELWNMAATPPSGSIFTSHPYAAGITNGPFDYSPDLTGAAAGTHYITVKLSDLSGFRTATFIITRGTLPSGVTNINNISTDVLLYPNPARDELNVVYDANADVKNIAVYNIIGKVMTVYKVNGPSANLNLENMPSGIYFVRLVNSHGQVVVTKKFTKQ